VSERERTEGQVLGDRYRLVERLGQGGFGDVWRAEELLPDGKPLREVALKLLVRAVASDWAEEARIIATLRHPALVTVYAAGILGTDAGELPFVAMELLRGDSLGALVARGRRVAWRRALSWAREVAAALDEIHRAGVVHLDLKPSNLFLAPGGVKVLDFGLARQGREREVVDVGEGDGLSTAAFLERDVPGSAGGVTVSRGTRQAIGTPGFMAPEVLEGGEATHAADAYALAACLVELITGHLPQDVGRRPRRDDASEVSTWLSEVQTATVHGRLRSLDGLGLPPAILTCVNEWLRLDPVAREIRPGELRRRLDEVWERPFGAPSPPFQGLSTFRSEHEGCLPGRDAESERLARDLVEQPALVLYGPAGAGLTSLALAGVVPEFARRFADGREDWHACHVRLGDEPEAALERALKEWWAARVAEGHLAPVEGASTSSGVPPSTLDAMRSALEGAPFGLALVLEDLHACVTLSAGSSLAVALGVDESAPRLGLRVVGLTRTDGFEALVETEFGRELRPFARFVGLPTPSAAEALVREPAAAARVRIDGASSIVTDVKAELEREGASLAAVSLALERLWRDAPTVARWREGGGVVGALAQHAERVVASLGAAKISVAEWLLVRLVRADGSSREVELAELVDASPEPGLVRTVVGELVRASVIGERAGRLSLTHPALALRWPRLHDRRLHDVERLTFLEELCDAASRWRQQGGGASGLWPEERVVALAERFPSLEEELRPAERAFVSASRGARRRARLRRWGLAAGACALLAGIVSGERVRDRHTEAQVRELEAVRRSAAVERLVMASRRTTDPYRRIALLGAAVAGGSRDRLLSLELFAATRRLPEARFLTLEPPEVPRFPWESRHLLGHSRSYVTLLDLLPDEGRDWGAVETRVAAHDEGIHDVEPFAFGRGFVTRGLDGTLKVWRLRDDRTLALAAISPMRCERGLSRLHVADRAPVVACATADGLVRWDLRADHAATLPLAGRLLALSPDGTWVAAARQRRVQVWREGRAAVELASPSESPTTVAAFSAHGAVVALVTAREAHLYDLTTVNHRRLLAASPRVHGVGEPVRARFTESGVDLAVCDVTGVGAVLYLRDGGRAPEDGAQPSASSACRLDAAGPPTLRSFSDYQPAIGDSVSLGPRRFEGGFELEDGRRMTRDLVAFDPTARSLSALTRLASPEGGASGDAVVAVARLGDGVLWQHGRSLVAVGADRSVRFRREASLLAICPDGRALAWRAAGDAWEVLDAVADKVVQRVRRAPGFVLGVEPSCRRFFVQRLDGRVASASLDGPAEAVVEPRVIDPGAGGYAVDGYVFDVRPSAARGDLEPGLWLAWSTGAMARADASGALRSYGHAAPRATAMADGPLDGELLFADEAGVFVRATGAQDRRVVAPQSDREWSDARTLPGGEVGLLGWSGGLALVDLARGELLGSTEIEGRERFASWDADGSVVAFGFALAGPPEGELVPIGAGLAREVAARASNLVAELDPSGAPRIRLR